MSDLTHLHEAYQECFKIITDGTDIAFLPYVVNNELQYDTVVAVIYGLQIPVPCPQVAVPEKQVFEKPAVVIFGNPITSKYHEFVGYGKDSYIRRVCLPYLGMSRIPEKIEEITNGDDLFELTDWFDFYLETLVRAIQNVYRMNSRNPSATIITSMLSKAVSQLLMRMQLVNSPLHESILTQCLALGFPGGSSQEEGVFQKPLPEVKPEFIKPLRQLAIKKAKEMGCYLPLTGKGAPGRIIGHELCRKSLLRSFPFAKHGAINRTWRELFAAVSNMCPWDKPTDRFNTRTRMTYPFFRDVYAAVAVPADLNPIYGKECIDSDFLPFAPHYPEDWVAYTEESNSFPADTPDEDILGMYPNGEVSLNVIPKQGGLVFAKTVRTPIGRNLMTFKVGNCDHIKGMTFPLNRKYVFQYPEDNNEAGGVYRAVEFFIPPQIYEKKGHSVAEQFKQNYAKQVDLSGLPTDTQLPLAKLYLMEEDDEAPPIRIVYPNGDFEDVNARLSFCTANVLIGMTALRRHPHDMDYLPFTRPGFKMTVSARMSPAHEMHPNIKDVKEAEFILRILSLP